MKSFLLLTVALSLASAVELSVPSSVPTESWMASINSSTPLYELVLPGTHDSAAYNVDEFFTRSFVLTQTSNITEQLERGIRYFDLRVGICADTTDKLCMYHGNFYLNLVFGGAVGMIQQFLVDHPTECAVLRLRREVDKGLSDFQSYVEDNYLSRNAELWFQANGTKATEVTLGDARGSVLLFWDSGSKTSRYGFDYNTVDTRIKFEFTSVSDITSGFQDRAKAEETLDGWFENPSSGLVYSTLFGQRLPFPDEIDATAAKVLPVVSEILDETPMQKGIVSMDFPTDEIINKLIMLSVQRHYSP